MKAEFNQTYELLYAEYVYENQYRRMPFADDEYYFLRVIRKAIDEADRGVLRSDAKYFLLVNFHHLIVRPLIDRNPLYNPMQQKPFGRFLDDIQTDIHAIISAAKSEISQEKISGHHLMAVIDRIWRDLRTTRFEVWG